MPKDGMNRVAFTDNQITVSVVTSLEDLMHVFTVRAIAFLEEHGLRSDVMNDGNDFQCTHVLMKCDGEPIGSMRIRWFQDFAQFERTAIRASYRNDRIMRRMAEFAYEHVGRKGYTRILTHSSPLYTRLWVRRHGWRQVEGRRAEFSGYGEEVIELEHDAIAAAEPITSQSPIQMIHRIEGHWHQPSPIAEREVA
ncbi:MAG: GNAT family N-acetyltransferase [Rhodobacteraceae bacterium]|nr:GNAT family N-acetyltransferase [Paracoccaceae bacterium]